MSTSSVELRPPVAPNPLAAAPTPLLSGFGGTAPSRARLVRPRSAAELEELLASSTLRRGLIARGAGRSYGDPAQNAGGTVLDLTALSRIGEVDPHTGAVRAEAGATFGALLAVLAEHGRTLPVVPGTRHLTVGGAIAADVHGKNHPARGSIAAQLERFELCTPAGGLREVSPEAEAELFAATVGGMGLTGVVTEATLRTVPLRSPYAVADVERVAGLEQALALMTEGGHTHAIAWLDLMAGGSAFSRAVVTRSSEGPEPAVPQRLGMSPRPRLGVPAHTPGGLLRASAVRAFNRALWERARRPVRGVALDVSQQLFPLDRVSDWNRLYGPAGLRQYQFAVPAGREQALRAVIELLRARRVPMYLVALKRFGPGSAAMLSFPIEGWTLAIDLPAAAPGAREALDRADELVCDAGGRLYLAKDSRMSPATLAAVYPQLGRFRAVRARVDPDCLLRSDMSRRLELDA